MADLIQAYTSKDEQIFRTRPKPIVSALALLLAGVMTFSMGMTRYFFVEAMAWTFLIWGALQLYYHLMDYSTRYKVTEESFNIYTPFIFWNPTRSWDWKYIKRMDVLVGRTEAKPEDVTLQVYYTPQGSTVIHREDIAYDAVLAKTIAEHAGLKPKAGQAMQSFEQIPQSVKGNYSWQ
jgi:hypothetical protein